MGLGDRFGRPEPGAVKPVRTAEFDRIARAFGWSADPTKVGDDAALLPGRQLFCCDALAEGVHFRLDWSKPADVGWKAVAQNVSDILAMGGTPTQAVWSIGMGHDWEDSVFAGLAKGAKEACKAFGCSLVGGDTVRCKGPGFVSLSLLGKLRAPKPWIRSGAKPGDLVYLAGKLGHSAVGLEALAQRLSDHPVLKPYVRAHRRPRPAFQTIESLFSKKIHAAIDVSDGLSSEAAHLAIASGVALVLDSGALTASRTLQKAALLLKQPHPDHWILHGGEDHSLLFTAPPSLLNAPIPGIRVIGSVEEGQGVWRKMDKSRQRMAPLGYMHD